MPAPPAPCSGSDEGPSRWRFVLTPLLLLFGLELLGFALYAGTLRHGPIWDDHHFVFGQAFLRDCRNLRLILNPRYFFELLPVENAARPAWLTSILLDACLYRGMLPGYRLTSILWHCAGGGLLVGLAWRLSGNRKISFLAGLLFLTHAIHTEPVNILTFRTDLMAFVFMVLALHAYLKLREARGRLKGICAFALTATCGLAFLSKEMAASLPLLVLLTERLFPTPISAGSKAIGRWPLYACLFGVFLSYLVFRMPRSGYNIGGHQDFFSHWRSGTGWPQGARAKEFRYLERDGIATPDPLPWQEVYASPQARFRVMSKVFGSYLRMLFWPHPLQGDYAPGTKGGLLDAGMLSSCCLWALLIALGWFLRRMQPLIAYGLLWVPLALLPVSGIISIVNLQAERYLYIPSAGYCLALAAFLVHLADKLGTFRVGKALGSALCLLPPALYGFWTVQRNKDFKDDVTFFTAACRADRTLPRARFNLGAMHQNQEHPIEAEAEYREALRLWPGFIQGRIALGALLVARGRLKEGIEQLETAARSAPGNPLARYNLGMAYWLDGRLREASRQLEGAAMRLGGYGPASLSAGIVLVERDEFQRALFYLLRGLHALDWDSPEGLYYLALAYRRMGRTELAERTQEALSQISPGFAAAYRAGIKPSISSAATPLLSWPSLHVQRE